MRTHAKLVLALPLTLWLAGCSLAPETVRPETGVASAWPASAGPVMAADQKAAAIAWQEFFRDPALKGLIERALANNANLEEAVANVERARAQYRISRSDLLPKLNAGVSASRQGVPAASAATGRSMVTEQYQANLGITAFELDFFGRVRNLSDAALQSFLATEQAQRSTQLSLVAEVANAWLTLLSDKALLRLTDDTLKAQQESYDLIKIGFDRGVRTQLELSQARTTLETARANHALYRRQVDQDINALAVLVGGPVDAGQATLAAEDGIYMLPDLPGGLPSDLLVHRPDVLQAEYSLRSANANIGAARAAFFPSISLTSSIGTVSGSLSNLFDSGTKAWSVAPSATLPIFDFGANEANLGVAKANRDIAVAQYRQTVRTAFQEVANGLAARGTLTDQLRAQEGLVAATQSSFDLSRARYERGVDDYLTVLDSQRALYTAQQNLISVRLLRLSNLVTLYKVLGGGTLAGGTATVDSIP
ncbi:efflux transporter outer membrane subunit [Niveispirillum sp. SYP-B3756]|uniref:efflux transporter outer membrane subunit n=1 Tax=Niveispirillum sp. SYP-B3756 TaxID=2662178 RepID=UPI00129110B5|nr:efflux transporter outer membrane subunit [Niveispirillum sp. SYP-B3756]MQP67474.1 efflux transporter outer membrane subunit [Niveispirillum sp. SYP-B3756]